VEHTDDALGEGNSVGPVATYFKDGQHWDLGFSAWAAAHGIPVPPQLVRRFRVGVGRLIDGGFDVVVGCIDRKIVKQDFNAEQQRETVRVLADAGRNHLVASDPNVAEAVARSFLNEHKLKLDNRTRVAQAAFNELINEPPPEERADTDLDVDWLNHFSEIAGQKSSPEMQALLGKILAGEIRQPGAFSPMTINVLANLTPKVAKKFEDLCSISVHISGRNYIPADVFPTFSANGIGEIDFSYSDLLLLRQYQLLAIEQGTSIHVPVGEAICFTLGQFGYHVQALVADSHSPEGPTRSLRASLFSVIGDELRPLLQPAIPEWLEAKITEVYKEPGWELTKIPRAELPSTLFVK
jgi:hypothetical protein